MWTSLLWWFCISKHCINTQIAAKRGLAKTSDLWSIENKLKPIASYENALVLTQNEGDFNARCIMVYALKTKYEHNNFLYLM